VILLKKFLAFILVLSIILIPAILTSASTVQTSEQAKIIKEFAKNETVYVNLKHNGDIDGIYVVNRIETPEAGVYTDTGNYSEILNLTNDAEPSVENGKVSWQLPADPKGFYYQGTLSPDSVELPFILQITYTLDGKERNPDDMIGESGKVGLKLEVKANDKTDAYFADHFMLQIQAPVSLDNNSNINAVGSSTVIVGRTATLAYMVMPGSDAEYEITFDSAYFEMNSISITSTFIDMGSIVNLDIDTEQIKADVSRMSEGTGKLVEGTQELKNGLTDLQTGMGQLAAGGQQIQGSLPEMETGVKTYFGSIKELSASAAQLSANLEQLAAQGKELSSGFARIKAGIGSLLAQFSSAPLLPAETKAQLTLLQEQLNSYEAGLNQYVNGTAKISDGMKSFSTGMNQLSSADKEMLSGLSLMVGGITELTNGLTQTSEQMSTLPAEVQKLIDGQQELKNGIDESIGIFDELGLSISVDSQKDSKPISFVSSNVTPRSVQFVMKTPELTAKEDRKAAPEKRNTEKGFWEKLLDLFR
jgi:X-X-X-Leu-X-X-Gly heptad repeat protein